MAKGKFDMSEFLSPVEGVPESDTTREIAVDDIVDNPRNFYPRPDNAALAELMESIRANGLLEPPTVVPDTDGKYRLISGHSRMAAVRLLASSRDESEAKRFATVFCRVLPDMTPEQEECAVIEANRQRVKSPALLAQEAERLTAMYIRRREAGEELPGRIRDRVAEAMQVNKTKLANLSAIKRGLKVPGIVRKWEAGELPEAAALEIARMDDETQYRLLDWVIDSGCAWTINNVREFSVCWTLFRHECPDAKGFCTNARRMYQQKFRGGVLRGCSGCCRTCLGRDTCSIACRFVLAERPAGGIAPPPQKTPTNPAINNPRLKGLTPRFCARVKALREATGLTKKEFAESIGEYQATYSAWENASMAGSGSIPKLALALGTTMDYLCGLTDDPSPTKTVSSPEWQTLDAEHWPEEGALVVLSYPTGLGGSAYLTARCCGGVSDQYPFISTDAGISVQDIVECKCDSWLLISERQRGEK